MAECAEKSCDASPSRSEILAALDFEIASVEKEHSSPGWTKWTFYGVFATLVWMATNEFSKRDFSVENIVFEVILFSVLADLVRLLFFVFKPDQGDCKNLNRFRLTSQEFGKSRLGTFGSGIRILTLLLGYFYLKKMNFHFLSYWFVWLYSFMFVVFLGVMILSYLNQPLKKNSKNAFEKHSLFVVFLILLSLMILSFCDLVTKAIFVNPMFSASDFRIAMLGSVFLWLIPIAFDHGTENQPLLEALKRIRRDLAFNRIDVSNGLIQADIALDGMRAEDYVQIELQAALFGLETASRSMREYGDRLDEANALVKKWEITPPPVTDYALEPSKMLMAVLESCTLHKKNVTDALSSAEIAHRSYFKKRSQIKHVVAEAEIVRIDSNINMLFTRLKDQSKTLDSKNEILANSLVRLYEKNPTLVATKAPPTVKDLPSK